MKCSSSVDIHDNNGSREIEQNFVRPLMLSRILLIAICALGVFSGCSHSKESNLVGSWRGNINEMAGEVRFASDHTFASREWDATNLLSDAGDWHISSDKLVINFHGDTRAPDKRTVEFSVTMHDQDHLTLRQANGVETVLKRLK